MAALHEKDSILAEMGRIIRSRRAYLGRSQQQIADRIGVHKTYVSQIERGLVNMHITLLGELAIALDISIETLLEPLIASLEKHKSQTGNRHK